jgi:hypothetical protein
MAGGMGLIVINEKANKVYNTNFVASLFEEEGWSLFPPLAPFIPDRRLVLVMTPRQGQFLGAQGRAWPSAAGRRSLSHRSYSVSHAARTCTHTAHSAHGSG